MRFNIIFIVDEDHNKLFGINQPLHNYTYHLYSALDCVGTYLSHA